MRRDPFRFTRHPDTDAYSVLKIAESLFEVYNHATEYEPGKWLKMQVRRFQMPNVSEGWFDLAIFEDESEDFTKPEHLRTIFERIKEGTLPPTPYLKPRAKRVARLKRQQEIVGAFA
jgi:hypothetical protein